MWKWHYPGFKTQDRHHQKSKTGVSVAPLTWCVSSKKIYVLIMIQRWILRTVYRQESMQVREPPWFWNPGHVQNPMRGISGPTKAHMSSKTCLKILWLLAVFIQIHIYNRSTFTTVKKCLGPKYKGSSIFIVWHLCMTPVNDSLTGILCIIFKSGLISTNVQLRGWYIWVKCDNCHIYIDTFVPEDELCPTISFP